MFRNIKMGCLLSSSLSLLHLIENLPRTNPSGATDENIPNLSFERAAIIAAPPSLRQRARRKAKLTRLYRSAHEYSIVVDKAAEISPTNKTWAFHFELTSIVLYRTLLVLLIQADDLVFDRDLHDPFDWPYPTCRKGRTIGLGWIMACAHESWRPPLDWRAA